MNQFSFDIQTFRVKDGKTLGSIKPDNDGFYDLPIMPLGKPSRNNIKYGEKSVVDSMNNVNSRFYKLLSEGSLEGEWGHPLVDVNKQVYMQRIVQVDRNNVSHYFNRIYSKTTEQGTTLIRGKFKPFGAKKQYMQEALDDPNFNIAFSIRTLCTPPKIINGIQHKDITHMITIDAVGGPGFEESSKRYANESIEVPVTIHDLVKLEGMPELVGVESFNDEELFDILGTDKVSVETVSIGIPDIENKKIFTINGQTSIFHNLYRPTMKG